jgi:predicted nucleotidyltransferase
MNPILESKMPAITELCRKYGVAKLEVFGSANTPEFDPERSDFDFILELEEDGDYFARYMEFTNALERLLERSADFVSEERLRPRFLNNIAPTREVLFASTDKIIAA